MEGSKRSFSIIGSWGCGVNCFVGDFRLCQSVDVSMNVERGEIIKRGEK